MILYSLIYFKKALFTPSTKLFVGESFKLNYVLIAHFVFLFDWRLWFVVSSQTICELFGRIY